MAENEDLKNPKAATAEMQRPEAADKPAKKLPRVDSIPVVARADGMGAPPLPLAAALCLTASMHCLCPGSGLYVEDIRQQAEHAILC
jgi:hypothetical protein